MADTVHIQLIASSIRSSGWIPATGTLDIAHIVLSSDSLAASLSHSNEKEPVEFTFPSVYKA